MKNYKGLDIHDNQYTKIFGGGYYKNENIPVPFEQDLINCLDKSIEISDNGYLVILTYADEQPIVFEKELLTIDREYPHSWHYLWKELLEKTEDWFMCPDKAIVRCREFLPNFQPAVLTHLLNEYYKENKVGKNYICEKFTKEIVNKLNVILKDMKVEDFSEETISEKNKTLKPLNYFEDWEFTIKYKILDNNENEDDIFYLENIFYIIQNTDFNNRFNASLLFDEEHNYLEIDNKEKYYLIEQMFEYIIDCYFSELDKMLNTFINKTIILDSFLDNMEDEMFDGFDLIRKLFYLSKTEFGTEDYDFHSYQNQFKLNVK